MAYTICYLSSSSFMHQQLPIQLISMLMWNDLALTDSLILLFHQGWSNPVFSVYWWHATHWSHSYGSGQWDSLARLHKCRCFPYPVGKAGVRSSRWFFSKYQTYNNLLKYQGCKTYHRSQKSMCPQAMGMVGKEEEQRSFNAIMYPTKIVEVLVLPS